jgi:hypothetical protein
MKRFILALALILSPSLVWAQASYTVKDAGGVTRTVKSNDCSSTICPIFVPVDTTGAAFGVTGNPFFVTSTTLATAAKQDTLLSAVQSPIPTQAPTVDVGAVGVSQTTVGTTNAVSLKYLNTTAIAANSGNKDGGTLRTVIATDQLAIALWGHVATGAAPPANITYNGGLGSGATGGLARANIICDQHTFYTGSDNGSKTLVAGVSGRKTYICGFLIQTSTTATTLTLYKGTDADCATSGAAIGPPYALVANDRVGANSAFWNGFVTATNADYVCINASAGNPHTAEIWYAIL